jgi:hypothetical protein
MSFSRMAPVGFQRLYGRFNWSRLLWPIAQTAADVRGTGGGELAIASLLRCIFSFHDHSRSSTLLTAFDQFAGGSG